MAEPLLEAELDELVELEDELLDEDPPEEDPLLELPLLLDELLDWAAASASA